MKRAGREIAVSVEHVRGWGRRVCEGIAAFARSCPEWSLAMFEDGVPDADELKRYDGFIWCVDSARTAKRLVATGKPVIDLVNDGKYAGTISVGADHIACGQLAARHFITHRMRRFAFCGWEGLRFSMAREDAFVRAIEHNRYECAVYRSPKRSMKDYVENSVHRERLSLPPDEAGISKWLKALPKPVGVFCANDLRAWQLNAICRKSGISVPQCVAILGAGAFDASATTWKDKKGSINLTLTEKGAWNSTRNGLDVNNGCAAKGTVATPAYRTIEVAFKMRSGRIMFASGCAEGRDGANNSRFIIFDHIGGGQTKGYFDGTKDTLYLPWTLDASKLRTMTGVYNDKHTVTRVFGDGVQDTGGGLHRNTWGSGDGKVMIGDRAASLTYPWSGEVYAVRLYDRELTSAEIANNHALDLYRFSGETGSPAEQFSARITIVQVTGTGDDVSTWTEEVPGTAKTLAESTSAGEVTWRAKPGVWRVKFELLHGSEQYLFHTQTQVFDLRHLRAGGLWIVLR